MGVGSSNCGVPVVGGGGKAAGCDEACMELT